METKSSGFTLIELLVVVAILGILAAVGIVSYSGYVKSAKIKSTQNVMLQLSLAQVEHYSSDNEYYGATGSTCSPDGTTSSALETHLLGGADSINADLGFEMCVVKSATDFTLMAVEVTKAQTKCTLTMSKSTTLTKSANC